MLRRLYPPPLLLILLALTSWADDTPAIIDAGAMFHPEISEQGMVVSQEVLASQVGAEILAQGGNAVDAAVATGFALAVTLPQAGNIGGGGFMLVYLADEERTVAIDYRETAPMAAYEELFLDNDGTVDREKAMFSHLAAGVPGTVAGLLYALDHYGSMSREQVLAPAIRLAKDGIKVTPALAHSLERSAPRLRRSAASREYFFHADGTLLRPGDLWRQTDLAWSLTTIADEGADAFYHGAIADKLVAEMERSGGLIGHEDLAAYRAVEREPVRGSYRGYEVVAMPPPSSGGVHLIQMLNVLEGWELAELGHNSAAYLHHLIETMRRAYADRSQYLGDPDFHDVPVAELIDKTYADALRARISLERATPSTEVAPGLPAVSESPQTTHYSVWDRDGNVVTNTYTLNFSYGNGISVPGAGFLLNNEMDDFSAKPGTANAFGLVGGEANAIEPGKRPLSSMTPTLVFRDGQPVIATGSPGGSTIITIVLQILLNIIDFDMNVAEATAAPRVHHQWLPDEVMWENGISADTRTLLEARGHILSTRTRPMGRAQSIMQVDERFYGAADPRWPGAGAAAPEKRASE